MVLFALRINGVGLAAETIVRVLIASMKNETKTKSPSSPFGRPSAAERLDAILRVATELFNKRGVGGTTLDDVAAELGIRKASLYNYIKSKNELLYLCHMRALETRSAIMDFALTCPGNGIEKIIAYLDEFRRILWGEPAMFPLLVLFDVPEDYRESQQGQKALELANFELDRMSTLLEMGMEDGSIRRSDPDILIFGTESPYACLTQWHGLWNHPPGDEVHKALNEFIVNGLRAR